VVVVEVVLVVEVDDVVLVELVLVVEVAKRINRNRNSFFLNRIAYLKCLSLLLSLLIFTVKIGQVRYKLTGGCCASS